MYCKAIIDSSVCKKNTFSTTKQCSKIYEIVNENMYVTSEMHFEDNSQESKVHVHYTYLMHIIFFKSLNNYRSNIYRLNAKFVLITT